MYKKIESFEDLILFLEKTELSKEQISTVVFKTINIMLFIKFEPELKKKDLIKDLKEFWINHGHKPKTERPIMLIDPLSNQLNNVNK